MKRIILIVMAGLMAPAGLHAQKAYKDADNKVILDMSVEAGMPEGAVTTDEKKWTGIPANSGYTLTDNLHSEPINAKVYHKLEIAPRDMNNLGEISGSGTLTMNWATAFSKCKESGYEEGGWRLPTQRELQMMWIFKSALETLGATAFSATNYWSATEYNASFSWNVRFSNGNTPNDNKTNPYRVRCVREL